MLAITRAPRLLVKLPSAPDHATFDFGDKQLKGRFEGLFQSIRSPAAELAGSPLADWRVMTADEARAEVTAWDLCHHIVRQGFGVTGLSAALFAEPDLEQQWITGTPAQHALAVTRGCDRP